MTTLLYDGSFEGFLTAVFRGYRDKISDLRLRKVAEGTTSLFGESILIDTDLEQSGRVWAGLNAQTSAATAKAFYCNYLAELPEEEDNMLEFLRYLFASGKDVSQDFSHPAVLRVSQVAKMVGREKHRMEAFVRFRLTEEGLFHASIEPDFNVLPLIDAHFSNRYADQRWLILDTRRGYGLYYDLEKTTLVYDQTELQKNHFASGEESYQRLWRSYFHSTNISERRNMKLHLQHVPLRYWKYLSEKHGPLSGQ